MKEITGIFKNKKNLDLAFEDLKKIGIEKDDLELLAREDEVKSTLGKDYASVYDLNSKSNMPRIKYISEKSFYVRENLFITILFYAGIIGAVIAAVKMNNSIGFDIAIAFFAGILFQAFGIAISGIFRKRHGDYIERKLNKGGFLFWIKLDDKRRIQSKACKILRKHSAKKVRVIKSHYTQK